MNPEAMITTLKSMKLHGMADAVGELSAQSSPAYQQPYLIRGTMLRLFIPKTTSSKPLEDDTYFLFGGMLAAGFSAGILCRLFSVGHAHIETALLS